MIIENIFEKSIDELELQDIIDFFKLPKEESDIIEYKSFHVKNQTNFKEKEKAVLKTICAFLNSSGGLLIWGAPIEKLEGKLKIYAGELSPVKGIIKKDNFISKITNRIIPLADKILFKTIPIENDSCIVLIEVAKSEYKPHQFDNRYWMRLDGQTKVAPHHYVQALFNQIKYPNLEGYLKLTKVQKLKSDLRIPGFDQNKNYLKLDIEIFIFNYSGLLNEENLSIKLVSNPGKFRDYRIDGHRNLFKQEGHIFVNPNAESILRYGEPYEKYFILLVDEQDLRENNFMLQFWLSFGGKKSPPKRSIYEFNVKDYGVDNYNDLLVQLTENKLAVDLIDKSKNSKMLKHILRR